jgi:molecular chaperone Hsp33
VVSGQALNGNGAGLTAADSVLAFTIPHRNVRGRIARMDAALGAILAAHDYPPALRDLLAEALALTVLVGATLKTEGQTTVQAQSKGGIVDLLVCDYRAGEVRGYLRFDAARAAELRPGLLLPELFGEGYLAITLDQIVEGERYQGIVPLEGDTLCHAVERYFAQSEQVPTLVRAAIAGDGHGGWIAGGLLVQHLPHGEVGGPRLEARDADDWTHVAALAGTVSADELTDPSLGAETLLWRLFNEDEVRVTPPVPLVRGCRCTVEHFRDVLARFPESDLAEMQGDDGRIEVNCEFCSRRFPIAM